MINVIKKVLYVLTLEHSLYFFNRYRIKTLFALFAIFSAIFFIYCAISTSTGKTHLGKFKKIILSR